MVKIYKTNIENPRKKNTAARFLNRIAGPGFWNVDLEDSDKILRIEASGSKTKKVEGLLKLAGFYFEELPYQL
jgi:hypothetical protein